MKCPSCHAENEEQAETCFTCGHSLTAVIKRGSVIASRYEILNPLGKGGMGMVYKAHDRVLEEDIAIKVLRADVARSPDMARRFRSEIRLARKVTHRNVCRIHEYGEELGVRYISMELIEGVDLKHVIRDRKGALQPKEAFEVSIQIAKGLQAIHDVGIIHRDLKTANIMRDPRGSVKLMDFGIAKQEGSGGATATGDIVGTPEYMSPEQARGQKIDTRSDIYALGIVIYEIFSGDVPFRGDTPIVTIFKHIQDQPLLEGANAPAFPAALVPVLRRVLAKDPNERFANADELADALRSARSATFPGTPSQPPAFSTVGSQADAPPAGIYVTPTPGPMARPFVTPTPGSFPAPTATPATPAPIAARAAVQPAVTPLPLSSPPTPAPVTPTPMPSQKEVDTAATHNIEPPTASFAQPPAESPPTAVPFHAPRPPAPVQRSSTGRLPKAVPPPPAAPAAEVKVARQQTQRLPAPVIVPAEPATVPPVQPEVPARRLLLPVLIVASLLVMILGVFVVRYILKLGPSPSPSATATPTSAASVKPTPQATPSIKEEVFYVPGATPTPQPSPTQIAGGATPSPQLPTLPTPPVRTPPPTPTPTPPPTPTPTPPPTPTPRPPTPTPRPTPTPSAPKVGRLVAVAPAQANIQSREQIQKPGDERAKAAEIAATMELDVTPGSIGLGEAYTVKIYVTPTNDKPFKVRSLAVMIRKNSVSGPWTPTTLLATAPGRGERTLLGEVTGTWEEATTWVLEAKATTERGDTISNRVALRK